MNLLIKHYNMEDIATRLHMPPRTLFIGAGAGAYNYNIIKLNCEVSQFSFSLYYLFNIRVYIWTF